MNTEETELDTFTPVGTCFLLVVAATCAGVLERKLATEGGSRRQQTKRREEVASGREL